jgi:hypothetical protein
LLFIQHQFHEVDFKLTMIFMNYKNSLFVILLTSLLSLFGCDRKPSLDNSIDFLLDNPTNTTLSVSIDSVTHQLKPHSGKEITLDAGKHSMISPATGKISFIVYANSRGGIINPSFSPYIAFAEVYAIDAAASKSFAPGSREIEIDGVIFEGPFHLHDDLFIEDNWSYGVYEDLPDEIAVYGDNKGNIKNKIFAKKDFIRYFEESTGSQGEFDKLAQKGPPPKAHYPSFDALPVFENPKMEAAAKDLKSLYQRYLVETKPAQQFKLSQSYSKSLDPIMKVMMIKDINLVQKDMEAYNSLIGKTTDLMATSARVIPN